MVTLLGFMCILFNVGLLVVMMPDLEGPVGRPLSNSHPLSSELTI